MDFLKKIWKKFDIGQEYSKHFYTFLNNPGKLLFSIKIHFRRKYFGQRICLITVYPKITYFIFDFLKHLCLNLMKREEKLIKDISRSRPESANLIYYSVLVESSKPKV